jgi:hypothetical protein
MTKLDLIILLTLLCASASISVAILYWLVNVAFGGWRGCYE